MQIVKNQKFEIDPNDIKDILVKRYSGLMSGFYEMQSSFLSTRYKIHTNLESSNIIICFIKDVHLSIIRQREQYLDHDISINNFLINLKKIQIPTQKIVSIVNTTGIPKETVRRKINNLKKNGFIFSSEKKEFYWDLTPKRNEMFFRIMKNDIKMISKFVFNLTKYLNVNLSEKTIQNEIESQFSFYFYHFLSCQLNWFKMWQNNIKDIDLLLITLQALIPTLQYDDKQQLMRNLNMDNLYTILGKTSEKNNFTSISISASSVSEVTGIPRATCIRKLEKLQKLGVLDRENQSKRYFINQTTNDRTRNVLTKSNVLLTINVFSQYFSIILNALIRNKS